MEELIFVIVILFLSFVGFLIYFTAKVLGFFINATRLYRRMISRQDVIVKLLVDIRDNTKVVSQKEVEELQHEKSSTSTIAQNNVQKNAVVDKNAIKNPPSPPVKKEKIEKPINIEKKDPLELVSDEYEKIKGSIIEELEQNCDLKKEMSILQSYSRLTFMQLKKMGENLDDLTEEGAKIYCLIASKVNSSIENARLKTTEI